MPSLSISGCNIIFWQKHEKPILSGILILFFPSRQPYSSVSSYPIIKRRIAWLIGKWIGDMNSTPNNPRIWEVLVHLLADRGPGTDAVVRLAAAEAIRQCVDVCFLTPSRTNANLPSRRLIVVN
jgi:hypothetical protein